MATLISHEILPGIVPGVQEDVVKSRFNEIPPIVQIKLSAARRRNSCCVIYTVGFHTL